MTSYNYHLDLVNVDLHIKFGQNLSIGAQDIEREPNWDGMTENDHYGNMSV